MVQLTCDQTFFFFFQGRARREEKIYIKKNSLSVYSRERHRGDNRERARSQAMVEFDS